MAAHVVGAADVARIGSTDVRPERAAASFRIICGIAEIVEKAVRISAQFPRRLRRHGQRGAVRPAPDELRGEPVLGLAVAWPLACEIRAKPRDILLELAEDQEGAALAQQRVHGKIVRVAVLIRLAEVDLAMGDRRPGAVAAGRAAARQRVGEAHVDERLAYAVTEAEMLGAIRQANDTSLLVDVVGIFAELDMQDFQPQRQAQRRQNRAQRIAPAIAAVTVVERAYIVAQLSPKVLRNRQVIAIDKVAAGEIAVHAVEPEDSLPVLRCACSDVAEPIGTGSHALLESLGEGDKRRLAELERRQTREGEGEIDRDWVPLLLDRVAVLLQPLLDGLAAQHGRPNNAVLRPRLS